MQVLHSTCDERWVPVRDQWSLTTHTAPPWFVSLLSRWQVEPRLQEIAKYLHLAQQQHMAEQQHEQQQWPRSGGAELKHEGGRKKEKEKLKAVEKGEGAGRTGKRAFRGREEEAEEGRQKRARMEASGDGETSVREEVGKMEREEKAASAADEEAREAGEGERRDSGSGPSTQQRYTDERTVFVSGLPLDVSVLRCVVLHCAAMYCTDITCEWDAQYIVTVIVTVILTQSIIFPSLMCHMSIDYVPCMCSPIHPALLQPSDVLCFLCPSIHMAWQISENELRDLFSECSEVRAVRMVSDRATKRFRVSAHRQAPLFRCSLGWKPPPPFYAQVALNPILVGRHPPSSLGRNKWSTSPAQSRERMRGENVFN